MLELLADDEAALRVLAEASAAFGQDLRELAKASAEIHRNRIAQPLLCAAEAATWAALKPHLPAPRVFAGYRYLHIDYEAPPVALKVDVKGPFIGIGWEF